MASWDSAAAIGKCLHGDPCEGFTYRCGPQKSCKWVNLQNFIRNCVMVVNCRMMTLDNYIDELCQVVLDSALRSSRIDGRRVQFRWFMPSISNRLARRESVSSKAIDLLPRARDSTTTADQRGSALVGFLVTVLCLEICSDSGQARNPDRLASQGVSVVLEVEVATGQAENTAEITPTHCPDGPREFDVGRGADRSRAMAEARHSCFPADCESLLANSGATVRPEFTDLEHVCPQPSPGFVGVRFYDRGYCPLPCCLHIRCDGDRLPPHTPLQRDPAPNGRLDDSTATRNHTKRS